MDSIHHVTENKKMYLCCISNNTHKYKKAILVLGTHRFPSLNYIRECNSEIDFGSRFIDHFYTNFYTTLELKFCREKNSLDVQLIREKEKK